MPVIKQFSLTQASGFQACVSENHLIRGLLVHLEPLAAFDEGADRLVEQHLGRPIAPGPHALVEDAAEQGAHRIRLRLASHRV